MAVARNGPSTSRTPMMTPANGSAVSSMRPESSPARGLVTSPLTNQAAAADLPIAAFTRGMTSSAINCIERLASAGSTQSMPA